MCRKNCKGKETFCGFHFPVSMLFFFFPFFFAFAIAFLLYLQSLPTLDISSAVD